ncbi:MAG: hypothetical protein HYT75_00985 [Deltaproteobacteria bacterium]|nr:hypothetical protein [Deltaproteobacteria bacterium]
MSIEENTIKNSGLTLLSHAGNFIGFISYQVLQCSNSHILYFHDLMIKKSFQSLGLFRTALMMSIVCASQDYKMDEFTGMTITYNARVIKSLYFKPHIFKNISFPTPSNKHKMLLREHGSHFFDPRELDIENGIVRKMWLQSKKDGQHINDNSELSILTGTYLNPVDGDSIVLLFDIDEKSIEHINNFLKERVGQTP